LLIFKRVVSTTKGAKNETPYFQVIKNNPARYDKTYGRFLTL